VKAIQVFPGKAVYALAWTALVIGYRPLGAAPPPPPPKATTGLALGAVVDDSGAPVALAKVFVAQAPSPAAHQVAGLPLMTRPQLLRVTADANGQFAAGNLPAGDARKLRLPFQPASRETMSMGRDRLI
jgi:ABC-type glycerol-3-phosphate transport system substrate-binding protein